MSDTNVLPKRRHIVTINIQADDWDSMIRALKNITFDLSTHEPGHVQIISGGLDSGYAVTDEYYPDQTHEKYFEELNVWLRQKDGEK